MKKAEGGVGEPAWSRLTPWLERDDNVITGRDKGRSNGYWGRRDWLRYPEGSNLNT